MTRGTLVIITDEGITESLEFNGDMYYSYHGQEVIEGLREVTDKKSFVDFVQKFNKENFGYKDQLTYDSKFNKELFNFTVGYIDNWFSDYLYIKNLSSNDVFMNFCEYKSGYLKTGQIVSVNFGSFADDWEEQEMEITDTPLKEKIINIFESHNFCKEQVSLTDIVFSYNGSPSYVITESGETWTEVIKNFIYQIDNFDINYHLCEEIRNAGNKTIDVIGLANDYDIMVGKLDEISSELKNLLED